VKSTKTKQNEKISRFSLHYEHTQNCSSLAQLSMLRTITRAQPLVGLLRTMAMYHSEQYIEEPTIKPGSPQFNILDKAIKEFVPIHGFQHKAILESARTFGYADTIQSLFTNGTFDLIKFHLATQRSKLHELAQGEEFQQLTSENDKLKYLLKKRLSGNIPIAQHLSQLQGYLILPPNIVESSNELHQLSDDLRFLSGDKSNDFAWYSKRLSLSSSYVALELFMSNDKSENFKDTLNLADSKIDKLNGFSQTYDNIGEFVSYTIHSGISLFKSQASRG
jgi:ubiquinone biosynthesis protein COQ9